MKIALSTGEHRGGVPPMTAHVCVGCRAANHLVYEPRFEEYASSDPYNFKWDSDPVGNLVWFDTEQDAERFICRKWPGSYLKAIALAKCPQLVEAQAYVDHDWYTVWESYLMSHNRIVNK